MTEYIQKYEEYILSILRSGEKELQGILDYHRQQIEWLQHERVIHLAVMLFTAFLFLLSFCAFFIINSWPFFALFIIFLILTFFYIKHYYFLENTVQRWYRIYNSFNKKINNIGVNELNE